jgi:hypothetical protein
VAIDLTELFRSGGAGLIDFLDYCVYSRQLEPVFAFLVGEYRNHPTPSRALALYELFCTPAAPAKIKATPVLPPLDWRIHRAVEMIRQQIARSTSTEDETFVPNIGPSQYLFDFIARHLENDGLLHAVSRQFDPGRTPLENLPGGKMTPGQRAFLEKVWKPSIRPRLIEVGFWRIADIGG